MALINERDVIERIPRHLGLREQGVRVLPARAPPEIVDRIIEPCFDDPFPDYDTEPVYLSSEALAQEDGLRERLSPRGRTGGLPQSAPVTATRQPCQLPSLSRRVEKRDSAPILTADPGSGIL